MYILILMFRLTVGGPIYASTTAPGFDSLESCVVAAQNVQAHAGRGAVVDYSCVPTQLGSRLLQ